MYSCDSNALEIILSPVLKRGNIVSIKVKRENNDSHQVLFVFCTHSLALDVQIYQSYMNFSTEMLAIRSCDN